MCEHHQLVRPTLTRPNRYSGLDRAGWEASAEALKDEVAPWVFCFFEAGTTTLDLLRVFVMVCLKEEKNSSLSKASPKAKKRLGGRWWSDRGVCCVTRVKEREMNERGKWGGSMEWERKGEGSGTTGNGGVRFDWNRTTGKNGIREKRMEGREGAARGCGALGKGRVAGSVGGKGGRKNG
ncbi:hypothetical protein GOBAR_AA00968 [Gossypium barbadense]|uniref:Uncharacterized protein n=1 Tax=Gossypium barbadense TaxID=3634 RepID=A0A2P5YVI4_GOSBA|nr:hypothetical protein GOBAR_AA00968 [Gossypium barbadense]